MRPARDSGLNPLLALMLCAGAGAAFAALRLHVARVLVLIVGTGPGYRAVQMLRAWLRSA